MSSTSGKVQVAESLTQTGREKGLVYNIPCESDKEGHKHTLRKKNPFFGLQDLEIKKIMKIFLSLSFQFSS